MYEMYRSSQNQPSPAETLSGRDVEVEPATRHPATYCMPVPSGRVWDPCVVCKGKHPHFDPNDPRVQLQRTLDRLEEERTRKQMEADTWQLAMEEERARNSQPQTALDMLPSFLVQELRRSLLVSDC